MAMQVTMEAFARENPLDVVEEIVTAHEWPFDRQGDEELSVSVAGSWCDYHLGFSFSTSKGGLQLICAYDIRVPQNRHRDVHSLLAQVNEHLWLGHFEIWSDDSVPMFRHAILTRGGGAVGAVQMEELIEIAITECERFYPAFQFVIWGGKSADEAVTMAMLETMGEA